MGVSGAVCGVSVYGRFCTWNHRYRVFGVSLWVARGQRQQGWDTKHGMTQSLLEVLLLINWDFY